MVAALTLLALAAATRAWVQEGQWLHMKVRAHPELPRGLLSREQTFVHREETLAQDAAAAAELHPEPAVRGGEGLRDVITAKPTWEVEKMGEAAGRRQEAAHYRQTGSGIPRVAPGRR